MDVYRKAGLPIAPIDIGSGANLVYRPVWEETVLRRALDSESANRFKLATLPTTVLVESSRHFVSNPSHPAKKNP